MSLFSGVERFATDLICGDFSGSAQNDVAAEVVAALISLIPVVGDIMGVRDVAASVYYINKKGGFGKSNLQDDVNLAFAAFSLLPEIGGPFKHVFEPLWRERKVEGVALHTGVDMVEHLLGMNKGGAVRWIKALDWAGKTQMAIVQINSAIDLCVQLLETLAQDPWWCPDGLARTANDILPGVKSMKGKIEDPIHKASSAIHDFLTQLLGEHAAAIVIAVGENVLISRAASSGSHEGHAAEPHVTESPHHAAVDPPTAKYKEVEGKTRTNGEKSAGNVAKVLENAAYAAFRSVDNLAKGLAGQHIADYYCIEKKGWGLNWQSHDYDSGGWQGEPRKINAEQHPVYLCLPSKTVLTPGIDSAFVTARPVPHEFAIVEAKARFNPLATAYEMLGEANAEDQPSGTKQSGRKKKQGGAANSAPTSNGPAKVMQMSHMWIAKRLGQGGLAGYKERILYGAADNINYTRHVMLVSPLQASEHITSLTKILQQGLVGNSKGAQALAPEHATHDAREFTDADIDAAEREYKEKGVYKYSGKK